METKTNSLGLNNKDNILWMLEVVERYHRCASKHIDGSCQGAATTWDMVHGHVREAGFSKARNAVQACHDAAELRAHWQTRLKQLA